MASRRGLPFRPTLISLVVLVIVLGAGGVGTSAWITSGHVVDSLWRNLARQLTSATTQRTLRYLEPAVPYVEATQRLAVEGRVDPTDALETLDYFNAAVTANPQFTWCSWASASDGTYLTVHRTAEGMRAGWREQKGVGPDGKPITRKRELILEGKQWKTVKDEIGSYDPRTREWFKSAIASDGGKWTDPFVFATNQQPGFMYVSRYAADGVVKGVWSVEYEVSYLSEFLASLHVGERGRVYVVTTKDGRVVGHPSRQVVGQSNGTLEIEKAEGHRDPMLAGAWKAIPRRGSQIVADVNGFTTYRFDDFLAVAEPFPKESGIDWMVLVVVPAEDVFGDVVKQAWTAVGIALGVALLAILVGVYFSNRVSRALRGIADEMDRVGQFDLRARPLAAEESFVREVNDMGHATERMKSSLRSFGKYVPRDVVQDLLQSGEEAVLGGREERLTVLFSDIADFTSISEQLAPAELVKTLGEYLEQSSNAIRDHHGTVDKFIGDAVMAFWGAPRALVTHPLDACRGALAMAERIDALSARWKAEGKPVFRTRIGVNTGTVVVGNIGSPDRLNYTVMGDAVNVASRLEGLNKEYGTTILVGEETAELVKGELLLRPVDWVAVKGRARAVLVYELLGEKAALPAGKSEAVAVYSEALELYRKREFAQAAARFVTAGELFGADDRPSKVMSERALRYASHPPPLEWDGAIVMHSK